MRVYPACAGIDHNIRLRSMAFICLPRMRGDRPSPTLPIWRALVFTPHARGSTNGTVYLPGAQRVYPACAGIDPSAEPAKKASKSLPRMRGDRPEMGYDYQLLRGFTPHARGSTVTGCRLFGRTSVYPACAGIDPSCLIPSERQTGLPRMRGDRPHVYSSSHSM